MKFEMKKGFMYVWNIACSRRSDSRAQRLVLFFRPRSATVNLNAWNRPTKILLTCQILGVGNSSLFWGAFCESGRDPSIRKKRGREKVLICNPSSAWRQKNFWINSQNSKVSMVTCVWVCEGRARPKRRFFFNVHIRLKHIIIIIIIITHIIYTYYYHACSWT